MEGVQSLYIVGRLSWLHLQAAVQRIKGGGRASWQQPHQDGDFGGEGVQKRQHQRAHLLALHVLCLRIWTRCVCHINDPLPIVAAIYVGIGMLTQPGLENN